MSKAVKELSDIIETEVKFRPLGTLDADTLQPVFGALKAFPSLELQMLTPKTVVDVYFDSAGIDLGRLGTTFRLRTSNPAKGYRANFKPPTSTADGLMTRRELRTWLAKEAADRFLGGAVEGLGAAVAAGVEAIRDVAGADASWVPTLRVESARRLYLVYDRATQHPEGAGVGLLLESVRALDVTGLPAADVLAARVPLVEVQAEVTFSSGEVDIYGGLKRIAGTDELAEAVITALAAEPGHERLTTTKYQHALGLLGMIP